MNAPAKPFERCYWVVPGMFLAGRYPGGADAAGTTAMARALLSTGIRTIVNLTEPHETTLYGSALAAYEPIIAKLADEKSIQISLLSHPIHDMGVPSKATMREILDDIDVAMERNTPVYVHCWGGYGRTGTVIGCWLARHGEAVGHAALERIDVLRTGLTGDSPQTIEQRSLVGVWEKGH